MNELVLAADVGGTNCRLALYQGRSVVRRQTVPTAGHGVDDALQDFVDGASVHAACLAVAGPVDEGHARLTNHFWRFDQHALSEQLGCPVRLVNDFHAAARGVPELGPQGWRALNEVPIAPGPIAVLGPGTGLGQALLVPREAGGWCALPGEGGHVDFAPNDLEQARLWAWLHARYNGHVSVERVLSGAGLLDLHHFHREEEGRAGPELHHPAQVSAGTDEASVAAVRSFVRVLGARAGCVALQLLPTGGVWICGGIAPRLPLDGLVQAWRAKGRFEDLLRRIPLRLVTDPDLGLLGAAALARERASTPAPDGMQ